METTETKFRKYLFLLMLIVSASVFAVCIPTQRALYAPAVVDENFSEMINIIVETRNGTGELYASVGPTIGAYTQESEKTAAKVAYDLIGSKDCDIMLKIDTPESVSKIDGPSAGAAMTILILSALENKQLRSDFAITGTIEEDLGVGPVGGVPLKAEAVARLGKRLFLVPFLDSTDKVLSIIMQENYNITIFQVGNATEAYNIALNASIPQSNIILSNETIPIFPNATINHSHENYFVDLTQKMIQDTEEIVNDVSQRQPSAEGNLLSRLEIAKAAINTSNYYTAANTVFILSIDSSLLDYSESNFVAHYIKAQDCISSYKLNDVNDSALDNFELAAAANLRYLWAKKRMPLNQAFSSLQTLSMKLNEYNDVLYAENWCYAARDMSNYQHTQGKINMTEAKKIAEELINKASNNTIVQEENDLKWHLDIAKGAYSNGEYVEAIIDSNFVLSSEAISDLQNKTIIEAGEIIDQIINGEGNKTYKFLWPQVYQNHAKTFERSDSITAARLYLFADGLENSFSAIQNAPSGSVSENETQLNSTLIYNATAPPTIERSPMGETRTFSEQKPIAGWDFRFLIYLAIMIMIGYIAQYERNKRLQGKGTK